MRATKMWTVVGLLYKRCYYRFFESEVCHFLSLKKNVQAALKPDLGWKYLEEHEIQTFK